jgi:opacity protein-like surface antigen
MMKEERAALKVFFRIAPIFLLAFLFFGSQLSLYSAENRLPRSLSFSLGYFHPNEESFKELYGGNTFQLNFNVSCVLLKSVSVFSGLRYISCKGETKIVGTEIQEEKYRLKFTMYSIPIGLICSFSMKNMHPFLGGGVSYNIYSEKWGQLDISFEGKKAGFFLVGGIEYPVNRRFSLLGSMQYSSIPTRQGAKLDENVDLGGVEFSLGFSFHLKPQRL